MAVTPSIINKEFKTQFRNGDAFGAGGTTDILQCNVGDLVEFRETLQVTAIVNDSLAVSMTYTDLGGGVGQLVSPGFNFKNEGLAFGQTITVFKGAAESLSGDGVISFVTGTLFNTIRFGNAAIDLFLTDGYSGSDIKIKVKSAPNSLRYNYGVTPETFSVNNYDSTIDGTTQAYTLGLITGSLQPLVASGTNKSWDLTVSLQARFIQTIDDYTHEFEVIHVFRPHWYIEAEDSNLEDAFNPSNLFGVATRKYVNGWFFGFDSTAVTYKFEDTFGIFGSGNVGYYGEALNGFPSIYSLTSIAISNPSATGKIEVSELNSVTAVITASDPVFTVTQRAIAHHSKRPRATVYSNKPEISDVIFVRDSKLQDAGSPAAGSTIITNMVVVDTSTTVLTVTFDVSFSAGQQAILNETDKYELWLTVGDQSLTAATEKPVNIILDLDNYSKNTDDTSLVSNFGLTITDTFNSFASAKISTDINGWDGDWYGAAYRFDLNQIADNQPNIIETAELRIIATDGTDEFTVKFKSIPIGLPSITPFAPFLYQQFNISVVDTFNIPITNDLNIIDFSTFNPGVAQAFQVVNGRLTFRIPWRDWIVNGLVPIEFFDAGKPNDNLNEKTSNYSGVLGFDIFIELFLEIVSLETGNLTEYKLRSDQCEIKDFDVDPGAVWTASPTFFDLDGLPTLNLFTDEVVQIDYIFTHSLGTLSPQDLWGFIWIEKENGSEEPFYLSTWDNWTSPTNPLTPTDSLASGNDEFVEIISTLNQVILRCRTNTDNLIDKQSYFVRARLGKQS